MGLRCPGLPSPTQCRGNLPSPGLGWGSRTHGFYPRDRPPATALTPPDLVPDPPAPEGGWELVVELGVRAPSQTGLILAITDANTSLVLSLSLTPTVSVCARGLSPSGHVSKQGGPLF